MPQGYELFLIIGVIVLLFGGSQLPKLARSLGQAKREFESGTKDAEEGPVTTTKTEPAKAEADSTETAE